MGKLFGRLYGYWLPSGGWEHVSALKASHDGFLGGETEEFRHPNIGTLTVHRPWGMDDVPLQFTLVLRERPTAFPKVLSEEVAKLFIPSDWIREGELRWDHACTVSWQARPWQTEDSPILHAALQGLASLFGKKRQRR